MSVRRQMSSPEQPTGALSNAGELRRGFLAMMVLWPGVVPFGIAFAIAAQEAGFTAPETQVLSLLVFAAPAQLAVVSLNAEGAGILAISLTVLLLGLRPGNTS